MSEASSEVAAESSPVAVCESCAGEDEELFWVWPLPAGSSDSPQLWCAGCRDRFPYEDADEPDTSDG